MKFHCMNSVELILLKCIPRGHPNPCSRVGLSCSIFKNTSATCAYPLVSNARKLKRDKRSHACAQGTFSYTPCSRRGLTKNICFSANIYVPKNISISEVCEIIKEFQSDKASDISVRVLKIVAVHVAEHLSGFTNKFMELGTFPKLLKIGKISPVHKKGDVQLLGNYRPTSVLPIGCALFSKFLGLNAVLVELDELSSGAPSFLKSDHGKLLRIAILCLVT